MEPEEEKIKLDDFLNSSLFLFDAIDNGHDEKDLLVTFLNKLINRDSSVADVISSIKDEELSQALEIIVKGRTQLRVEPFECVDNGYTRLKLILEN